MIINNFIIKSALSASIEAGKAILEIYNTDFSIEKKTDNSPITLADKESHNIIKKNLLSTNLPILSEEGLEIPFQKRKNWELFWLVDPLDGTKEFIKRNGEFTVNIALIENNYPIGGVIFIPVLNTLYYAFEGLGSYKLENADKFISTDFDIHNLINNSSKLPLMIERQIYTVVASRSHLSKETKEFIESLKDKHSEIKLVFRGSSLKLCMIAEGSADIYPRFAPTMEWDIAAGQAIVEISGGKVLNINQKDRIKYNKKDLLNPWFIVKQTGTTTNLAEH